ncbi:MAG: iron ABC transporter permease [Candidatus Bipolaricaulota bacterium]|nr:iron ABC transporter permease [Candidatus Bipolaricaulota bacterium]
MWGLVAIALLFLILFFYWPVARLLAEGLTHNGKFSLDFIVQILTDAYFQHVIGFTFYQALWSTLASIALGLPLAYILTHYDFPGKRWLRAFTIVPFVLPSITVALGFALLLGRRGYLNQLLMGLLGLNEPPLALMYSLEGIILAHAFYNAPIIVRTVHAAWEKLDPRYEESARVLGAGRLAVFKDITLPMIFPSLLSGAALVFIFCFLSFPIVLTIGGGRFSTIEVEIYTRVITLLDPQLLNYKLGAALALLGLVISLGMTYLYLRLQGSLTYSTELLRPRPTEPLFAKESLWRPSRWLIGGYLFLCALIFLGPMLAVLFDSFWEETATGGGWTLRWYSYIFAPDYDALLGDAPLRAVLNSLWVGLTAALLALVLGLIFAYGIARARWRGRRALDTLLMAPLATSSVILAFAFLRAFSTPPLMLVGSTLVVVLVHAMIVFPFVVRVLVPLMEGFDQRLSEAARTLGASAFRALREIELPLLAPGVLAGVVFAFALSLGEMSATLMLAPPGFATMPISVYRLVSQQTWGAPSAMSVLMIFSSFLAFWLLERAGERTLKGF